MTRPDRFTLLHPLDAALALVLLSRYPIPALPAGAFRRQAAAVWAFPIAGMAIAGPAAALGITALWLGLTPALAAGLCLGVQILLSGALHEDGLADLADGFWGGRDIAERLRIMKDSRTGVFALLALIMTLGLRWQALALLLLEAPLALIGIAALSRAIMPMLMLALPPARAEGLSHAVGQPPGAPVLIGAGLALGIALVCNAALAIWLFATAFGAAVAIGALARRKIGGQTGDVLGAGQVCAETACLIVATALL